MSTLVDRAGPGRLGRDGVVAFETTMQHAGQRFRYLRVDNRRAYAIGNRCDTCYFWFTRLPGADRSVSVESIRERLAEGLASASDVAAEQFSMTLAMDEYLVLLLDVSPTLTQPDDAQGYFSGEQVDLWGVDGFWGLPHYPKVPYYRLPDRPVSEHATLFQFVVPMFPPNWLEAGTVAEYAARLASEEVPTAVALSVLDVRQPAISGAGAEMRTHWCLAHFLLDGHHKMSAAAATGRPIRLLSFLAVNAGVSDLSDVDALLGVL